MQTNKKVFPILSSVKNNILTNDVFKILDDSVSDIDGVTEI